VKVFADTSVLVAALVEDQPLHRESLDCLTEDETCWVSQHSLAGTFAVLTGTRLGARISTAQARAQLEALAQRVRVVSLDAADYYLAIETAEQVGARGDDVLLLTCARKCAADRIVTLNQRHYATFAPDLASIIVQPG
jgi:predicted nucleic acid-binding protein